MNTINLQEGTVQVDGQWLTAEDIQDKIKVKMKTGELKFSRLAIALEELVEALEKSTVMDIELVLTREDHARLLAIAGGDQMAGIRRAIDAFVTGAAR
jgi:hypothetical protein